MSDLLTARQKFVEISGRYDLATRTTDEHDTDAGADFFIKAGQDFLDRMYETPKMLGRVFEEIAAGGWYVTFQRCRAITQVWVNNDEERFRIDKVPIEDIKEYYASLRSGTDNGEPAYYAPALLRAIDSDDIDNLGAFFNYVLASSDTYNGIILMPPVDEAYVVEVIGKFYSDELTSNSSTSFWTQNHLMTLVWASLYMLEVSYRNSEGAKDWLLAIERNTSGIDKDVVEENIAEVSEMDG